jgi:hypothetical protein
MFKIQLMYPKLKINVYSIFLNIGDLTFGITLVRNMQPDIHAKMQKEINCVRSNLNFKLHIYSSLLLSIRKLSMHKAAFPFVQLRMQCDTCVGCMRRGNSMQE